MSHSKFLDQINEIAFFVDQGGDPYFNMAIEEYLIHSGEKYIFRLWQNDKTVVIGRNQNPWRECNISACVTDGISIVRRLSGGGAVYHDIGNLNFSFFGPRDSSSYEELVLFVQSILSNFEIHAEARGRNDLVVDGCKVSGIAYFERLDRVCIHGTLLVESDLNRLATYLTPSPHKLINKGIESVRARVGNLTDINPEITVNGIIEAVKEIIGKSPVRSGIEKNTMKIDQLLQELVLKYRSDDWNMGKTFDFDISLEFQSTFGSMEFCFLVRKGIISKCRIDSDCLDVKLIEDLSKLLCGMRLTKDGLRTAMDKVERNRENREILGLLNDWAGFCL